MIGQHHTDGHHDDFGGLQRDLRATGANMDRRLLLRIAAIALPKAACDSVYATAGYEQSVSNLSQVSLSSDMVFSDGSALELATVTGSVGAGLTATLTVAV
jgi:hypothetical protein